MKLTKVSYKKLFNLGNYEHEEIGVECDVQEGDNEIDVFDSAKKTVNDMHNDVKQKINEELKRCKEIVENHMNYTGKDVEKARNRIIEIESGSFILPRVFKK